jgi:hypothetical protein
MRETFETMETTEQYILNMGQVRYIVLKDKHTAFFENAWRQSFTDNIGG